MLFASKVIFFNEVSSKWPHKACIIFHKQLWLVWWGLHRVELAIKRRNSRPTSWRKCLNEWMNESEAEIWYNSSNPSLYLHLHLSRSINDYPDFQIVAITKQNVFVVFKTEMAFPLFYSEFSKQHKWFSWFLFFQHGVAFDHLSVMSSISAALHPCFRGHHRSPADSGRAALHQRQQRCQKPAHLHHIFRLRLMHAAADGCWHQVT